jgi:hypothetical protein
MQKKVFLSKKCGHVIGELLYLATTAKKVEKYG